jgi:prevent-host-death family protein
MDQGDAGGGKRRAARRIRWHARDYSRLARCPVDTPGSTTIWSVKLVDMEIEEIGAFEAKTRLSELLERVKRGHVYRITKRGKPIAELRPPTQQPGRPRFGHDRGRIVIGDDFDAAVPDMKAYR